MRGAINSRWYRIFVFFFGGEGGKSDGWECPAASLSASSRVLVQVRIPFAARAPRVWAEKGAPRFLHCKDGFEWGLMVPSSPLKITIKPLQTVCCVPQSMKLCIRGGLQRARNCSSSVKSDLANYCLSLVPRFVLLRRCTEAVRTARYTSGSAILNGPTACGHMGDRRHLLGGRSELLSG